MIMFLIVTVLLNPYKKPWVVAIIISILLMKKLKFREVHIFKDMLGFEPISVWYHAFKNYLPKAHSLLDDDQ